MTGSVQMGFLVATVRLSTPLLLAATGELMAERAGLLNLSVEGMMLTGALAGFMGGYFSGSLWLAWLVAMAAGSLVALLFAWLTITMKANQVIVALGINLLAAGGTGFLYRAVFGLAAYTPQILPAEAIRIPWLSHLPVAGPILFAQTPLVYGSFLLLGLVSFVLNKTPLGLAIRAAGENAAAADTAGVPIDAVRYGAVLCGGALAGLGGAYLSTVALGVFLEGMTGGAGWIAVAIVIFGNWKSTGVLLAALTFGAAQALQLRLQTVGIEIPREFIVMIPYILTLVALAGVVKRSRAPAQLAIPYDRGERI
jgi:general nucleoside transport system permease protein